MQAQRLYLVDVGYGRGYVNSAGYAGSIDQAQEWSWSQALNIVKSLRKRGYVGAEAVSVIITPSAEQCNAVSASQ